MSDERLDPVDWEIDIAADRRPDMGHGVAVWIMRKSMSARRCQVLDAVKGWTEHHAGAYMTPTVVIDDATTMLTHLWASGVRPEHWGHEGEVAALKDHLADMRRLAAKSLEVELP